MDRRYSIVLLALAACATAPAGAPAEPVVRVESSLSTEALARLKTATVGVLPVTVIVMGEEDGTSPEATGRLEELLLNAGVRLVKRADMDRILAEAKLASGGYVADESATAFGSLVGAEILAIGSITFDEPLDSKTATLAVQFVESETGRVLGSWRNCGHAIRPLTQEHWMKALFPSGNVTPPLWISR